MKELSQADIDAIQAIKWGHRIPVGMFNGEVYYTPGELIHGPDGVDYATERFGLPLDLTDKTVLDIGAWDGYFSFEAERRGASLVVASDAAVIKPPTSGELEYANWGGHKGFPLARQLLDSNVQWMEASVYDIDRSLRKSHYLGFDVVLFYGVLYHLVEPFRALQKVRTVTAPGGVALIETAFSTQEGSLMELRNGFNGDASNWWYPTIECLQRMLEHVGFARTEIIYRLHEMRVTVAAYA